MPLMKGAFLKTFSYIFSVNEMLLLYDDSAIKKIYNIIFNLVNLDCYLLGHVSGLLLICFEKHTYKRVW